VTGKLNFWLSTATHINLREKGTPPKSELSSQLTLLQDVFQLLAVLESGSPDSSEARVAVLERGDASSRYSRCK